MALSFSSSSHSDMLSSLPEPDFSGIPDDPDVEIPTGLRVAPLRFLRIIGTVLGQLILWLFDRLRGRASGPAFARRLRLAFERLGPTFIKFGQMIGSSPGVFPDYVSDEFIKCLDKVPSFPFSDVENIMREDLGDDWRSKFKSIDPEPIAAASIAQVHFAELADGTPVVIKVQRLRIRRVIDRDLGILFLLAKILVRTFEHAHLANPVGVISDLNQTLHEELDFRLEANNMDRFSAVYGCVESKPIYAAHVHRDLLTRRLLIMERLEGVRVDDLDKILVTGVDPQFALALGMKAFFRTLMLHGFFHGDVHAGNLFISGGPRISFMDFGITGRFDDYKMKCITSLIVYMVSGRPREMASVLIDIGSAPDDVDLDKMTSDIRSLTQEFENKPMKELDFGAVLSGSIRAAVENRVKLPREFVLLVKQMMYFDRYAHIVAPDLDIFAEPFIIDFLWRDPRGKKLYPQLQFMASET